MSLFIANTFRRSGVCSVPTEEELEQRITEQIDSIEGAKQAIRIEIDKKQKAVDKIENVPRL